MRTNKILRNKISLTERTGDGIIFSVMANTVKISGKKGVGRLEQADTRPEQAGARSSRKARGRKAAARLVKRVGAEVEANFRAWLTRNFVDPRAGRIGGMSYSRAGSLDDRVGDGLWYSGAYDRAWADHNEPMTHEEFDYVVSHPLVALQLAVGISDLRGLRCLRRGLTQRVNALQRRAYRSRYYARDNARRRLLAAERRKISRRTTLNPCPTPEAFRAAFSRVGESVEAKIRFGGLVHDLECYVDNCLRIDERGEIVGRNGGVKAWLADNVPELYGRYKTIMRHKALARRVRQAVGAEDPVPTDALLDGAPADAKGGAPGRGRRGLSGNENYYATNSHHKFVEVARRRVAEMFAGCPNTVKDAFGRVDAALAEMEERLVAGTGAGSAASASHAPRSRASSARREISPLDNTSSAEPKTKDVGDRPRMRRMSQNRRR